jgi:hypothetical protein
VTSVGRVSLPGTEAQFLYGYSEFARECLEVPNPRHAIAGFPPLVGACGDPHPPRDGVLCEQGRELPPPLLAQLPQA